jgi:hypothetical protein
LAALALAFASVLGVAFILDAPQSRQRLADLWSPSTLVRTIVDDGSLLAEAGAIAPQLDGLATGALGSPHGPPAASSSDLTLGGGYAVDLGPDASIVGLKARWRAMQSESRPLDGLEALLNFRATLSGFEPHLVVGPLPSEKAARDLCAKLARSCVPTRFDGQSLAATPER